MKAGEHVDVRVQVVDSGSAHCHDGRHVDMRVLAVRASQQNAVMGD